MMFSRRKLFQEILKDHERGLSRVASSYTRDTVEREDLEQDIALAIWKSLGRFRNDSAIKTYVYRIAHNRGVNFITRRKPGGDEQSNKIVDASPSAEKKFLERERHAQLMDAVRVMPLAWRQVVTLYLEGFSLKEIGETLGISENAATIKLSRARNKLKNIMGKDHD
jgi:RNA polymerase sigma-70 factor, ECF subfamily